MRVPYASLDSKTSIVQEGSLDSNVERTILQIHSESSGDIFRHDPRKHVDVANVYVWRSPDRKGSAEIVVAKPDGTFYRPVFVDKLVELLTPVPRTTNLQATRDHTHLFTKDPVERVRVTALVAGGTGATEDMPMVTAFRNLPSTSRRVIELHDSNTPREPVDQTHTVDMTGLDEYILPGLWVEAVIQKRESEAFFKI